MEHCTKKLEVETYANTKLESISINMPKMGLSCLLILFGIGPLFGGVHGIYFFFIFCKEK